jgi:hypothetical protein
VGAGGIGGAVLEDVDIIPPLIAVDVLLEKLIGAGGDFL